jgi:hypothetical protein
MTTYFRSKGIEVEKWHALFIVYKTVL